MSILNLQPKIFRNFPAVKTAFLIRDFGSENNELQGEVYLLKQVHSDKVLEVHHGDTGFLNGKRLEADGMYTREEGISLGIRSADCLPVLFYNDQAGIVGLVHAGWRGTASKILQKAIKAVSTRFGVAQSDFYFYFGPAARECCYEITGQPETAGHFRDYGESVLDKREGKLFLDFVKANKLQLADLGVQPERIEDSGRCTIHDLEFPSHRRQGNARKDTLVSLIAKLRK